MPRPRIESIRPADVYEGTFAEYQLPELLIGVLRGNLTGVLEVLLSSARANYVYFKDGVPVAVMLPDAEVSLAQILVAFGEISEDAAVEVQRRARVSGDTESRVVTANNLVPPGALRTAVTARARAQLVKLFDAGPTSFRFTEGAAMPPDAELSILQPLPVIYEGLLSARDRSAVRGFLARSGGSRFRLANTYPHGVDPFEWGADVERAVENMELPQTKEDLAGFGLHPDQIAVVLTTLFLADMVEVLEPLAGRSPAPPGVAIGLAAGLGAGLAPAPPSASATVPVRAPSTPGLRPAPPPQSSAHAALATAQAGLQPPPAMASSPSLPVLQVAASPGHDGEKVAVARALAGVRHQSYFEVLRVMLASSADQIERACRYFVRMAEGRPDDPGARAFADLAREARDVLLDPALGPKYREAAERAAETPRLVRERQALEVGQKVDRAVRAMAEGRTGTADFLLEWAAELDATRRDLRIHRAFLSFCRAAPEEREAVARALRPMIGAEAVKQPEDVRLQLYFAAVVAALGDADLARATLERAADAAAHPLAGLVRGVLER